MPRQIDVLNAPLGKAYDEPVVMWRMRRADGMLSHAVLGPRPDGAIVIWFVNGRPLGFRDFTDWTSAIRWSDQLHAQNWKIGWRSTDPAESTDPA